MHTGQTLSQISSLFHGHLFSVFSLCVVVYCLHLGWHHNPSISWQAAGVWKHLCGKSACHAFLWERLIEIGTGTPSLAHSRILFTGRGLVRGLPQGFLAAYRVCCKPWSRSAESLENGTQPSRKKASELSWPLSKLNTFFFLLKVFTPCFRL